MKSGIYKIVNLVNNKVYVGSALNIKDIWKKHQRDLANNKHHSIKLQRAWNKYGIDNFKFEIIEECDKNILIKQEQYYIDLLDSFNKGYNCCSIAGSRLGTKASYETKIKMSKSRMGNTNCKGKIFSQKTRLKMSNSAKGNSNSKGNVLSKETKIKMSKSKIGRKNNKYNPTPILQYDKHKNFIKEWQDLISLKEAGFNSHDISAVCYNRAKSSQGYCWKFKK